MSKTLQVNGKTTGTVSFQTKEGAGAPVYGVPTWAIDNGIGATMAVAADGMSAEFTGVSPGTVNVTVVGQGDPTSGVDPVTVTTVLTVVPEEASTGQISFS